MISFIDPSVNFGLYFDPIETSPLEALTDSQDATPQDRRKPAQTDIQAPPSHQISKQETSQNNVIHLNRLRT